MTRIKYTSQHVQTIAFFEALTRARLKDCIDEETTGITYFVVEQNELGRALGKNAENVKRIEEKLNRKIKIVEFDPHLVNFVANLCYPVRPRNVEENGEIVTITPPDMSGRSLIIGRGAINLRAMEKVASRYFQVKEIKVTHV
ncbi:MAG: NusA-like transcription termination signal-binding factor [Nanoarchaeota archaeon]